MVDRLRPVLTGVGVVCLVAGSVMMGVGAFWLRVARVVSRIPNGSD